MATTKKAPLTCSEMLALIAKERQILEDEIGKLEPRQLTQGGVTDANWSVKDLMMHLVEWEQMFLGWYRAGHWPKCKACLPNRMPRQLARSSRCRMMT